MASDKPQVFLSYAHDDLPTVRRLYDALVKREVNVWFDKGSIRPGRWKKQIEKAIPQSRYFIFCVSSASIRKTADGSGFVDEELQQAYEIARDLDERSFTVVPVRLEEAGHGDHRLQVFQQYDLFEDWEEVVDRLAVYMGGRAIESKKEEELSDVDITLRELRTRLESLYLAEQYEKALPLVETILSMDTNDIGAWFRKGVVLGRLGRHEVALEAFEEAIRIDPDYSKAWGNKGIALGNLGRHEEALIVFEKAIRLDPDYSNAWTSKGVALGNLGRREEAVTAYEEAIRLSPNDASFWFTKGVALGNLGRHDEALEAHEETIRRIPKFANAWFNKGITLAILGRFDEALSATEEALQLNPTDFGGWQNKGVILRELGRENEAEEAFARAKELGFEG